MTAEGIVAAIEAGDLDGSLATIVGAARARLVGQQTQRWRITYGDLVITEDDHAAGTAPEGESPLRGALTLGEAATVERVAGTTWGDLSPVDSATHTLAVIAAGLHHRTSVPLKQAVDSAAGLSVDAAVACIDFYEVA